MFPAGGVYSAEAAISMMSGRKTLSEHAFPDKQRREAMGMENDAMLSYLENNDRFADLFNQFFFSGRQVVMSRELQEASEIYVPHPGRGGGQRVRDIKRRLESGACLKILAVEAQNDISYIMPWRIMDYDCREYERQIRRIQGANRSAEKQGEKEVFRNAGERLGRFRREDRIAPVYTICLYHGEEKWDGPRNLKDMVDFTAGNAGSGRLEWERCFTDYPMRLICANETMDCSGFRTSLGTVFALLPFRRDRAGLREVLNGNPAYTKLDQETAETVSALMGIKNFMKRKEEFREGDRYNMCQAIREMIEEGERKGENRSRKDGLRIFIQSNRDDGVAEEAIAAKLQKYYALKKEEAWKLLK